MDLNYLMTSDFNEGLTPEQYVELLLRFRYEYRLLSGKNSSYEKEMEKLKMEKENLSALLYETELKLNSKMALMEDELHNTNNLLNKKLTWKERIFGKINRNENGEK